MQSDDGILSLLLVEDNMGDARLIEILLAEEMAGDFRLRKVTTLSAACEALIPDRGLGADVALGPDIDVVLLDLTLPDSQGLDTLRALQRHCGTVPVVVLSGLDDEALALKALQLGAEDYLVKGRADGNLIKRSALYAIERSRINPAMVRIRANFDQSGSYPQELK
jgi:DNA-binding NarL/FixJ family response regulator